MGEEGAPSGRALPLGAGRLGRDCSDQPDGSFPLLDPEYNYPSPVILLANHRAGGGAMGFPKQIPGTGRTTVKNNAKIEINQKLAGPR